MSMTNQILLSGDPRRNCARWLALVALVGALLSFLLEVRVAIAALRVGH